jgi:TonB family protein
MIRRFLNEFTWAWRTRRLLRAPFRTATVATLTFAGVTIGAAAGSAGPARPSGPHDPVSSPALVATNLPGAAPHVSADRNGAITTTDGLTLRLATDFGSIRIIPLAPNEAPVVRYVVHIETDARDPLAKHLLDNYFLRTRSNSSGVEITGALPTQSAHGSTPSAQFWVHFEVTVPVGYHVDVKTGAGDIEALDVGGSASLVTQGGNILAGRIGSAYDVQHLHKANNNYVAVLRTEGGHIQVKEVDGDLSAFTAGGHIVAGSISGDASLHSGGGHIRAGKIGGRATLDTDGGNITVNHAESFVNVHTGGGQIDFGEVRGSVRAQTGGGGIRIMYVSGPMEVVSNGGSICLTRVSGAVQAATNDGTITAWINPENTLPGANSMVRLAGASQLASGNGDIVVFLPRNLAANIEAVVTSSANASLSASASSPTWNSSSVTDAHRIEADPAIHLAMQPVPGAPPGTVRAVGTLNGGGETLRLRTSSGNIRLQFLDSQIALREAMIRDEQARLNQTPGNIAPVAFGNKADFAFDQTLPDGSALTGLPPIPPSPPEAKDDWPETWFTAFKIALMGWMTEDPADFQKRLTYAPHPSYPALAQTAGIEGVVKLQVRVTKDGRVDVQKIIEGEPVLANAAIAAVTQWRAKPGTVNGKPVDISSTVTFNFLLH